MTAKQEKQAAESGERMGRRVAIFAYGVACYALFHLTALLGVAFLGNFALERTIDAAPRTGLAWAIAVDVLLLTVFALQHSVMARPSFKRWWTQFIPEPAERSTYVLLSCVALLLLYWQWQPIGGVVWNVQSETGRAILYGLYAAGWIGLVAATFAINHFDLFGLRQVWIYFQGRDYERLPFHVPGPYRLVRHPIYVGWLTIFWAAPTMTSAHLLFAVATTAYILIAIRLEERDLEGVFGEKYASYKRAVPMLIPGARRSSDSAANPAWGETLPNPPRADQSSAR